jgi:hypothetical protein
MLYFDLIIPYLVLCLFKIYSNVCICLVCCSLYFPNVLNACSLYLDNEQSKVPECVVGDLPEQQPGEDKCPPTHYVPFIYNLLSRITL